MIDKLFALLLLLLLATTPCSAQSCTAYNHTGVDYADPNISVKIGANSSFDCCVACYEYNQARTDPKQPKCKVGVWWRNALNFTGLCTLKETALQPIPRPLTASMLVPTPKADFRFASIYTNDMVLQSAPKQAVVWGFAMPGDTVRVTFDGSSVPTTISQWQGDTIWTTTLPATEASIVQTHTITAQNSTSITAIKLTGVLFGKLAALCCPPSFTSLTFHMFAGDVFVCSGQSNSTSLLPTLL